MAFLAERPDEVTWQLRYAKLMAFNTMPSDQPPAGTHPAPFAPQETRNRPAQVNDLICPALLGRPCVNQHDFFTAEENDIPSHPTTSQADE